MISGAANEGAVVEFIRKLSFVYAVYDVGIFAMREQPHLAYSADAVALVDFTDASCEFLSGEGDVHLGDRWL